jgi:uracil-DNA glycosylase
LQQSPTDPLFPLPPLPVNWAAELDEGLVFRLFSQIAPRLRGREIYPQPANIFAALDETPFARTRVVILGQDPYHGPGQAHGLSFSVPKGVVIPPSLRNMLKELSTDLQGGGAAAGGEPTCGDLRSWARQGVLLLNAVLTVEPGRAGAHAGIGWEEFTDHVIARIAARKDGVAFVLWGSYAIKKAPLIEAAMRQNGRRHLILTSPHPSPLSAHRGFFGSRPYSKINAWITKKNEPPIDWRLS